MIRILGTGPANPTPLVDLELAHGHDPAVELGLRGYTGALIAAVRPRPGDLTLRYAVEPLTGPVPAPEDLRVAAPSEGDVWVHQRVAAYAVVRSTWGVLATQLSERTAVPGQWNLPGGGIEPDEDPRAGLEREVFEETGQRITGVRPLTVLTRHWVGENPNGRLEDLHAVRIFFLAHCPQPSVPVLHDVGGSTAAARWTSVDELARLPLASSVQAALAAADVWVAES